MPEQPPQQYGYGNWGLAYPGVAYTPVVLVPRPPRPPVVGLAVGLAFAGVGLSALDQVASAVVTFANRDAITSEATSRVAGDPNAPDMTSIVNASTVLGLVLGLVVWLLPAAGTVVTAVLSRRGNNPARIVLASLMGVFAAVGLCGGALGLVGSTMSRVGTVSSLRGWQVVSGVVDLLLAGLAVAIGILLLLPAANRYFSAGPGRRFAPAGPAAQPPVPPGSVPWTGTRP
jgi:hypothetical protein